VREINFTLLNLSDTLMSVTPRARPRHWEDCHGGCWKLVGYVRQTAAAGPSSGCKSHTKHNKYRF